NAVLCNPRSARGNNRPPTRREQRNCAEHLAAVLELVRAPVVATLGTIALRALTDLSLREVVARRLPWRGRVLFPLYHPAARADPPPVRSAAGGFPCAPRYNRRPAMGIKGIGYLHLLVEDWPMALQFYRDVVGLPVDQLFELDQWVSFDTPGAKLVIYGGGVSHLP